MAEAKCRKCGGTATGNTFEEAAQKINHAVGLSRGIKCGRSYNCTIEIKDTKIPRPKVIPKPKKIPHPKAIPTEKQKPKEISQEKPKPKETSKPQLFIKEEKPKSEKNNLK